MAEERPSFYRRHRWLTWIAGTIVVVLIALAVTAAVLLKHAEPFLRGQIVAALSKHFQARVELDSFHMSLAKGLEAEGKGLRIWPPANVEGLKYSEAAAGAESKPLISLDEFRFHTPLHFKPGVPVVIRIVQLKGLKIDLPPRKKHPPTGTNTPDAGAGAAVTQSAGEVGAQDAESAPPKTEGAGSKTKWLSFVVDRIECTDAMLNLETDKPGKLPLEFDISSLTLTDISENAAMKFEAKLTNPRPVGEIETTGHFGPWKTGDPGESPVSGDYTFSHADLATFKGIGGILNSTGRYDGTLRDIVVDGETDTPDFKLTSFGNTLPLHTRFHAKVDGTNGDTWLQPVDATLGKSHFTAQGQIVRVAELKDGMLQSRGHDIALKVDVDKARIEDFLTLASKPGTTRILTGDVQVKTTLHIPPAPKPVVEKLELNGTFHLGPVLFDSDSIQSKIRSLSVRGQGHPGDVKNTDADSVQSEMDGAFKLGDGVLTLPQLAYKVPGAEIDVAGSYALEGGALNFAGVARMDATVSQMVGGWKGILLKPADHFFKKDGAGTQVPVQVGGTRENPTFEIEVGKLKLGNAKKQADQQQKPEEQPQPPAQQPDAKPEDKPQP